MTFLKGHWNLKKYILFIKINIYKKYINIYIQYIYIIHIYIYKKL